MASGPGEIEVYRSVDGAELAVVAATWHLRPTVTFESLHLEFQRDAIKAWKNYGCQARAGEDTPLPSADYVATHANRSRTNPWNESANDFEQWFIGAPGVSYFLHIDLAKNRDRAGIALVHRNRSDKRAPVVVDLMVGVQGRSGHEVQFADLRDTFVYRLSSRGFHLKGVSFDQWQSVDSQQILTKRGYAVSECSADKTMLPYDTLFDLIMTDRLDYFLLPLFCKELQQLRRIGGKKWDHPKHGSKDVSDAVACACSQLIQYEIEHPNDGVSKLTIIRRPATLMRPGID